MTRQIEAYTPMQMWFHKHMMHFVVFLIITGLPILSPAFSWIAYVVGIPVSYFTGTGTSAEILASGIQFLRLMHWVSAFLLTLIAIPFVLAMLRDVTGWNLWPDRWGAGAVVDGLKEMNNCYIKLEKARFGKFNTGQKASAWLIILGLLTLVGSGWVLVFRDAVSQQTADLARMLHALLFVLTSVTLIMHVYFSTHPINRAAFRAMFRTGRMDAEHVKEHHPYWYEKLRKKGQ